MLKKIFSIIFLFFVGFSFVYSETYEQVEKKYLSAYNNLTAQDRKAIESAHKQIMAIADKNIRMMVMSGTYDSLPAYCKKSSSSSSAKSSTNTKATTSTSTTTASSKNRMANLKNANTRKNELMNIISTHTFNGQGTANAPLLISEAWELYALTGSWNSRDDHYDSIKVGNGEKLYTSNVSYIKLTKDLDFENSLPFLDFDTFEGVFDGNNFAIKNVKSDYILFKKILRNGIVKNLKIENANFTITDTNYYSHPSPFCDYLEGTLINCVFDGKFSFTKTYYDIAYSSEGNACAIGCVSNNSSQASSLANNVKLIGCGTSSSNPSSLNDEISNWNALHSSTTQFLAKNHIVSSGKKLTIEKGEPTQKTVSNKPIPRDAKFSNIATGYFRYDKNRNAIVENIGSPFESEYWTTGSRIALIPNGKTINLGSASKKGTAPTFILKLYEKQIDGSYKETILDSNKAHVVHLYNSRNSKMLHIRYKGTKELLLYTNGSLNGSNLKFSQSQYIEFPSEKEINSIISSGSW